MSLSLRIDIHYDGGDGRSFKVVQTMMMHPVQSSVLRRFEALKNSIPCPYAKDAKVVYAPEWDKMLSVSENTRIWQPYFDRFIDAMQAAELDMFVVEVSSNRALSNVRSFSDALHCILATLSSSDTQAPSDFREGIETMGWDFTYSEYAFFVPTFCPFYHTKHPRYSGQKDHGYVVFQPDLAFARHGINSSNPLRSKLTQTVKDLFLKAGYEYSVELVANSVKAARYVKPMRLDEPPIRWWERRLIDFV